jgi:4-diphosphocytidyl-2-C-methyl-D-erythritol kinase
MKAPAPAKINLGLVVGPLRDDGRHELLTVYQRLALADRIQVEPSADGLHVEGYTADTLVRGALAALAAHAGADPAWTVRIEKRLPIAAGIAGGSSDAATALRLANETLASPLEPAELHELAATLGADVPFFLVDGPQLGSGDGTTLAPLDLPQDFWVVVLLPHGAGKTSTADVYAAFDARKDVPGFAERRQTLLDGLAAVKRPRDFAALPPNDLASSPLAEEIRAAGAFRADVSGAGPALYGLFHHRRDADAARHTLRRLGRTWLAAPAWYG